MLGVYLGVWGKSFPSTSDVGRVGLGGLIGVEGVDGEVVEEVLVDMVVWDGGGVSLILLEVKV